MNHYYLGIPLLFFCRIETWLTPVATLPGRQRHLDGRPDGCSTSTRQGGEADPHRGSVVLVSRVSPGPQGWHELLRLSEVCLNNQAFFGRPKKTQALTKLKQIFKKNQGIFQKLSIPPTHPRFSKTKSPYFSAKVFGKTDKFFSKKFQFSVQNIDFFFTTYCTRVFEKQTNER